MEIVSYARENKVVVRMGDKDGNYALAEMEPTRALELVLEIMSAAKEAAK